MANGLHQSPTCLAAGARVQLCNSTLQAFYGRYGTVLRIHTCPTSEGPATFYPHQIQALVSVSE